ncbi:MAG: hypothetical protein FJ118_14650 [Deltaproteobacteria bacterium]|nr:hypothetical protein [Deltaproteobacteria bacterium]
MATRLEAWGRRAATAMFVSALVWVGDFDRQVSALELTAKANTTWMYSYAAQLGTRGFFGTYNVDNSSTGSDFAPLNGWLGGNMVSGSNTGFSNLTTAITPHLKINKAVDVKAVYAIGPYTTDTAPGPSASISTGNWRLWRIAAQTPLGRFYYGKTFFGSRRGIQYDRYRRTEEFFQIQYSFVPFIPKFDPLPEEMKKDKEKTAEEKGKENEKSKEQEIEDVKEKLKVDAGSYRSWFWGYDPEPQLEIWLGFYPWRRGQTNFPRAGRTTVSYWNEQDLNADVALNTMCYLQCVTRSWKTALLTIWSKYREGPESQDTSARRRSFPPADTDIFEGHLAFEFNNGRLLLDTELDWYYRTIRYQRSLDGTVNGRPDNVDGSGSLFASDYYQSWRFKVELGFSHYMWQVRFFYAWLPGPDRRHGVLIDRQPLIQEFKYAAPTLFGTYSDILANAYSGGVGGFGDIPGASSFGVVVEHMVAANLMVNASFLTATRNSHGYGWGFVRPSTAADIAASVAQGTTPPLAFGSVSYGARGSYTDPAPAIPDNDLGWEVDAGIRWQLLRDWEFFAAVAFWKPGRWFSYACIDKSVANWDVPSSANNFGVNPGRTIDPVVAVVLGLEAAF